MSPYQIPALIITVCVETAGMGIYSFIIASKNPIRNMLCAGGITILTHTLFWAFFPGIALDYAVKIYVLEGAIVLAEAVVYCKFCVMKPVQAFLVSLILNLSSWSGGVIVFQHWRGFLVFQQ